MTLSQQQRWRAESEIIKRLKRIPSSREMQKLLKEETGKTWNHNIINQDLKKDLESLTEEEYNNKKGNIIYILETERDVAHDIAMNDSDSKIRLEAMKTVARLTKTTADVLAVFRRAQAEIKAKNKNIYNVYIGKPKLTQVKQETEKNVEEDN